MIFLTGCAFKRFSPVNSCHPLLCLYLESRDAIRLKKNTVRLAYRFSRWSVRLPVNTGIAREYVHGSQDTSCTSSTVFRFLQQSHAGPLSFAGWSTAYQSRGWPFSVVRTARKFLTGNLNDLLRVAGLHWLQIRDQRHTGIRIGLQFQDFLVFILPRQHLRRLGTGESERSAVRVAELFAPRVGANQTIVTVELPVT